MFSYTVKKGGQNFFDVKKVRNATLKGQIKAMMKAGAYCRTAAKNSMKDVGKIPKYDLVQLATNAGVDTKGMTREMIYGLLASQQVGLHAPPGHPPFAHSGLIKKHLVFVFEPSSFSVIVGPGKLPSKRKALEILEKGGMTWSSLLKRPFFLKKRPYMDPALLKTVPKFPQMFANTVKP